MLLDAILWSLRCSPYVPTITVALIFIYDRTFRSDRYNILAGYWQHGLGCKDQAGADGTIAAFYGGFDFFFQVCGWLTYPRDLQVHRALFWAESLKDGELSNFLGDLSVDDVFRIAIVQ